MYILNSIFYFLVQKGKNVYTGPFLQRFHPYISQEQDI